MISSAWYTPGSGGPSLPFPAGRSAGIPSRTCWISWREPGPVPTISWPTCAGRAARTAPNCCSSSRRTATTVSTVPGRPSGSTTPCSKALIPWRMPGCWSTAPGSPARRRAMRVRACSLPSPMRSTGGPVRWPWFRIPEKGICSATASNWTASRFASRMSTCSASIPRSAPARPAAAWARSSGSARTWSSRTRPRASTTGPSPAGAARRWAGSRTISSRWPAITGFRSSSRTVTFPAKPRT